MSKEKTRDAASASDGAAPNEPPNRRPGAVGRPAPRRMVRTRPILELDHQVAGQPDEQSPVAKVIVGQSLPLALAELTTQLPVGQEPYAAPVVSASVAPRRKARVPKSPPAEETAQLILPAPTSAESAARKFPTLAAAIAPRRAPAPSEPLLQPLAHETALRPHTWRDELADRRRALGRLLTPTRATPVATALAPPFPQAPVSGPHAPSSAPTAPVDTRPTAIIQSTSAADAAWPSADVARVLRWGRAQAIVALIAALLGAIAAFSDEVTSLWALSFALVAGVGAALTLWLSHRRNGSALGLLALLASHLGLLAWALALVGPRASLLTLAPPLVVLALRLGGRSVAALLVGATLALYGACLSLVATGQFTPALALPNDASALLDGAIVAVGMAATLIALLMAGNAETKPHADDAGADAWRIANTATRQQFEDDADRLRHALNLALRSVDGPPIIVDGTLGPLSETVYVAINRLATLLRDREERLRLEGAIAAVTRALEQQQSGWEPEWPHATGAPIDQLVARLRIPDHEASLTHWPRHAPHGARRAAQ